MADTQPRHRIKETAEEYSELGDPLWTEQFQHSLDSAGTNQGTVAISKDHDLVSSADNENSQVRIIPPHI